MIVDQGRRNTVSKYDFDLLVIGGGSGGVRAARWSSGLGAKVAICESSRYGGTCVIRGCIPKKLMVAGSELPDHLKYFSTYGWSIGQYELDWLKQKSSRDQELKRLEGIYENLLSKAGVSVLKGHGRIADLHTVEVDGKAYTARFILIAVGSYPFMPDGVSGIKEALTSDDVFELTSLPKSLLIMGSGYIGLEFASIFNAFGSEVTLVSRRDLILRGFDNELRAFLQEEIIKRGVKIVSNDSVTEIIKQDKRFEVKGQKSNLGQFEKVLFATGRRPNIKNLGLESVGVKTNKNNEIEVNKYFESSVKNIYALGDCANTPFQLTPVATAEGMLLAEYLFAKSQRTMDYRYIPTAIFSQPPAATVGLSEEESKESGYKVDVYTASFRPLKYTVTDIDKKTFMKIVVDAKTDKVLGVHAVGDDASEMMQGIAVALKAGASKSDFDKTIGIHPTSAEEFVTMRNKTR